ncbi:MAG: hypothetical protein FJW35_10705, partial [Acidobacteria bacterium]|nr:hypothetical protein [Acidobacteriota bacterium]
MADDLQWKRRPATGTRMSRPVGLFTWFALLVTAGCGYRMAGTVKELPWGIRSLAVPVFTNLTQTYRVEQEITRAVLTELNARTRASVGTDPEVADAVLQGEVRSLSSNPVTFGEDTFGSAFLVTVQVAVKLIRRSDG